MFGLILGWAVLMVVLVALGSVLGLLIGLGLLILALGYINLFLAEVIWKIDADYEIGSAFLHGLILFIFLILVNIPYIVVLYLVPHWTVTLLMFAIYVPVHGFVGISVANYQ